MIRGYRAEIDPAAIAFERAVVQLSEVAHAHHVTGNDDYLLQVEVADLPGVASVTSYVTMKTLSADTA